MLVLTRRTEEEIVIGDSIKVRIVEVKGNRVRIGIEAPPDVIIEREEIRGRRRTSLEERVSVASVGKSLGSVV